MFNIKTVRGNLFAHANSGVICHGVNAQGVMRSGFAKTLRETYPLAYTAYMDAHKRTGLKLGQSILVRVSPSLYVANLVTQEYYGRDGRQYVDYDGLEESFESLRAQLLDIHGDSERWQLHFPLIGCDLGGGKWEHVSPRINNATPDIKKTLYVLP